MLYLQLYSFLSRISPGLLPEVPYVLHTQRNKMLYCFCWSSKKLLVKIINYECPHYVTHCSYRRFRGSPRLNWVLVPFLVWGLKWKRHQPMALSLEQRSFLSIKSQMSGRWGQRRHCRWMRDGRTASSTAFCIPLPCRVSCLFSFLFIPFYILAHSHVS